MNGKWITFEGIGGAGKTTQIKLLHDYLVNNSFGVVLTKEPGGTVIGQKLREILVNDLEVKAEILSELFLFEADRHETIKKIVEPSMREGKVVLSDRGIDGSVAYQGFGRGLTIEMIHCLTSLATENKKPDLTILLDIEPKVAQERIAIRKNEKIDKFDIEKIEFQRNVRKGFLHMANLDPERVKVVDGNSTSEDVHMQIIEKLEGVMKVPEIL